MFYYECPWCGNRWYQEEEEPRQCVVCKHYCWEGTHEEHMKFPDLEAWNKFLEEEKESLVIPNDGSMGVITKIN